MPGRWPGRAAFCGGSQPACVARWPEDARPRLASVLKSLLMECYTCRWCGRTFERPEGPGRPPLYCSPSHRQRAHQFGKQQEAVVSALTKQMKHMHALAASVGGAEKLAAGVAEAARAQEVFAASVGGAEKLAAGVAEAARAQEVFAASVGGAEKLAAGVAEAARAQEVFAASVGGAEKLAAGVAEAARAQEVFAAQVMEPIRHLQDNFVAGVAEAARAQEALAAQVTAVAMTHQTFTAKVDELAKAQAAFASTIADSSALGHLQLSLGALQPEVLGSLAMSDSLVRLAGIAATRIEAAGFTDIFASALESLVETSPGSDVEVECDSSGPTSEELLTDHSELVRLVGMNLDPVTTRVLLAVLVVASLPFIADAVLTISLAVLGQCWEALKLVEEITSLSPAISGLLSVLTIWGVVYGRR